MKKCSLNRLIVSSILFGIALLPVNGNALDLTIEPRLQSGIMDYEFEQKPATSGGSVDRGFKLVSNMPFVGIGTTLFVNQFFLDFYAQKASSGSDTATNTLEGEDRSFDFIVDSDFEREEYSVSMGYALENRWALFGGYRVAKSQFANIDVFREVVTEDAILTATSRYSPSFEQDGFFFGSAYALPVLKNAAVTFNMAVALLDGKYDSRNKLSIQAVDSEGTLLLDSDGTPVFNETVDRGVNHNGDTLGLNFGVSWKGKIGEKTGYSLGVNGYSYDFESKSSDKDKLIANLSESVLRFSAGLSYQF